MGNSKVLSTSIDGYRIELSGRGDAECTVLGVLLMRELKATLKVPRATRKIEHSASGESHEIQAETIAKIDAWAAQNGCPDSAGGH